jgi:lysophospholipase L1-like esterase
MGKWLGALLVGLAVCGAAFADGYQSSPSRQTAVEKDWGIWLGPFRKSVGAKLLEDFGEQYIYASLNAALPPPAAGEKRVVFLGDSITDKWNLAAYFPGRSYVNRGIGSQTTPQMLLRFHADVVALKPAAVVILAGVNDTMGVFQVETAPQIEVNFEAMAEIAEAHGIKPIFSAVMPINNYTDNARTMLEDRKPAMLAEVSAWLKDFCTRHGYGFIDYGPVLRDDKGLLRADLTEDGVHPNAAGYALMAPIAEKAIAAALVAR